MAAVLAKAVGRRKRMTPNALVAEVRFLLTVYRYAAIIL
jgi:hypothetical protein